MKTDHSLAALCAALDVTRAGYHAWVQRPPSGRAQTDAALQTEIRAIHAAHRGRYGAPRIHAELQARGQRHGRKRIARLLRHAGLRARFRHATDGDFQVAVMLQGGCDQAL